MKIHQTFRIDESLDLVIRHLTHKAGLTKSEFFELATIDFVLKWNGDLNYEGINFKEYALHQKLRKLRTFIARNRNEFLSKNLIIPRINIDVHKLVCNNPRNSQLKEMVTEYLEIRKKEARFYVNNKRIMSLIKEYERLLDNNESLLKIKEFSEHKIDAISYIKTVTSTNKTNLDNIKIDKDEKSDN